jgi:hypothetical protein
MIEINYKDWWEICIENQHGLKDKNSAAWVQGDFTLFTKFKTNFEAIKKDEGENNACCIIGKPGLHLGDLIDYSWCNTYIGCAYHHKNSIPHNGFWAGSIDYLKAVDYFIPKIVLEDEIYFDEIMHDATYENTWFEYDGVSSTYSTISDKSGHCNHLRHRRQWYIETFKNYEVELMNSINKKSSTLI